MRKAFVLVPRLFPAAIVALLMVVAARPAAAQPAPTNLQITVTGQTMHLTWVKPNNACQTTQIEMGRYPGGNDAAAVYIGPVESYNYTYPYPGTYYVRVRCNIQTASNEVMVVLGAGAPPAPPEAVRAVVSGNTVAITWALTSSGTTGFRLEAGSAPSLSDLGSIAVAGTGLTVPNVPPGTYYLRVRSVGPTGQSAPSSEVQAVVGQATLPGVPGALQTAVNGSTMTLSWGAASGSVTRYDLEAGTAASLSNLGVLPVVGTAIAVPGVPPGTYFLRVRAVGPAGKSAPTADAQVTVAGGCIPPSAPINVTGSANGALVTIAWQAPASGSAPFTYALGAGSAPGPQNSTVTVPMGAALSLQANAPPGVYFVRIAATNACGTSVSPDVMVTVQ